MWTSPQTHIEASAYHSAPACSLQLGIQLERQVVWVDGISLVILSGWRLSSGARCVAGGMSSLKDSFGAFERSIGLLGHQ